MKQNWEIKKLGEVCEIRPPKNEARIKLKDTDVISFVPMEDLCINEKYFKPIKEKTLKEVIGSYTFFSNNDVLLAKITPCFENGKLGIAKNLINGIGFGSSEFIVFRTNQEILPEYLYHYYGASGIVDYVKEYIFDEDLLLVSEDGANLLARTYPIAFSISGKSWVNNHAHVLRFNNIMTQKFIELYLNSIKLDKYVNGMAQPKLNQAMLNKIPIPFPLLSEQKHIVTILDRLSAETKRLEEIYRKKIADFEELKKSILNKAFNGEL